MKQRREGWATRKFNGGRLGGVEGCATRHLSSQRLAHPPAFYHSLAYVADDVLAASSKFDIPILQECRYRLIHKVPFGHALQLLVWMHLPLSPNSSCCFLARLARVAAHRMSPLLFF